MKYIYFNKLYTVILYTKLLATHLYSISRETSLVYPKPKAGFVISIYIET